jgi:zinc transporter, ZIP family
VIVGLLHKGGVVGSIGHELWQSAGLSLFAGSSVYLGGLLASRENIQQNWLKEEVHHTVIAFGGGTLLSAVGLVLIPDALPHIQPWMAVPAFLVGGVSALFISRELDKHSTPVAQLLAMVIDFVPEIFIIGAVIGHNPKQAVMTSVLIFVQNMPESFGAYRELTDDVDEPLKRPLWWFFGIALSSLLFGLIGNLVFKYNEGALAFLMLAAAGAILYFVFQDIAPQAKLKHRHFPPMGAILGFALGIIGFQLA